MSEAFIERCLVVVHLYFIDKGSQYEFDGFFRGLLEIEGRSALRVWRSDVRSPGIMAGHRIVGSLFAKTKRQNGALSIDETIKGVETST